MNAVRSALALACALSLSGAIERPAAACGNDYIDFYTIAGARTFLSTVERNIARGSLGTALRQSREAVEFTTSGTAVTTITRDLRDAGESVAPWRINASASSADGYAPHAPDAERDTVRARARLLRGIVIARMNGQLNSAFTPIRNASAQQRTARFTFAIEDITAAVQNNGSDPRAQAYLAEARARLDPSANGAAALTVLRGLAQRDVLPDAGSWAMLSRLETDPTQSATYLARCRTMAGGFAPNVCTR